MKIISSIIFITVFIFSSIFAPFLGVEETQGQTSASWFNSAWTYRKPIGIGGSSSVLADYQISLTVDTASLISEKKMNLDCSDFRFTDSDGTTELSYWIESGCNSLDTKVWVRVPFVPISGATIYMYYGNTSAQSASNGANTFIFFDDFEPSSDKWLGEGQEYSTDYKGYVHATQTGTGEAFSSLISNVIGSGDFKVNLKIKNESSEKYKDCDYKHELILIDNEGETILDSSSYQDFAEKTYRIAGDNLKLKLYGYVKGCEDTVTKCSQQSYNGCTGCKCEGNQCPCLDDYIPNDDAPLCPKGYTEVRYFCKNEDFYDNYYKCYGTECRECRECKNTNVLTYTKIWIDDVYVYEYISTEPSLSIGEEELVPASTCQADGQCKLGCPSGDPDCSCTQQSGDLCQSNETCSGTSLLHSGSGTCCSVQCTPAVGYQSADLNCDGKVNLTDSAILMSFWGKDPSQSNSCQSPDINKDGSVNLTDSAIMMSQWTIIMT
jgi:hypothetical protein